MLSIELWLSIALHMGAAASRLAEVCWGLRGCRPLSRHPELWAELWAEAALCKALPQLHTSDPTHALTLVIFHSRTLEAV